MVASLLVNARLHSIYLHYCGTQSGKRIPKLRRIHCDKMEQAAYQLNLYKYAALLYFFPEFTPFPCNWLFASCIVSGRFGVAQRNQLPDILCDITQSVPRCVAIQHCQADHCDTVPQDRVNTLPHASQLFS